MKMKFGGTPPGPPPSPGKPWMWVEPEGGGQGQWLLMASDTADGIPESLDDLPKAAGK